MMRRIYEIFVILKMTLMYEMILARRFRNISDRMNEMMKHFNVCILKFHTLSAFKMVFHMHSTNRVMGWEYNKLLLH